MRKGKIFDEFNFLKNRYGLDDLELFVQKDSPFLPHPRCDAVYLAGGDLILLRHGKVSKQNLKFILHEICHAIQNKENRLIVRKNYFQQYYALEIEAELFAIVEYEHLYGHKYGSLGDFWELASFDEYKRFAKKDFCESDLDCMTPEEVYLFVRGLKGKQKRNILKRLNRNHKKTPIERRLSKICI